jgi:hypothetical protein
MIDTLRAIAPSIDPLVERLKEGTLNTRPISASLQFMSVQKAAANARVALERKFPELTNQTTQDSSDRNHEVPPRVREWARTVHSTLLALEARIRKGYRDQEHPVAVRDAIIGGDSRRSPNTLSVLSVIVASSDISNFDVSDPRNARALGIRSNLSALPLRESAA